MEGTNESTLVYVFALFCNGNVYVLILLILNNSAQFVVSEEQKVQRIQCQSDQTSVVKYPSSILSRMNFKMNIFSIF